MTTPRAYAETRWPHGGDGDVQIVGDVGQEAHHHELGGADAEGAHGEGEQGQGHEEETFHGKTGGRRGNP